MSHLTCYHSPVLSCPLCSLGDCLVLGKQSLVFHSLIFLETFCPHAISVVFQKVPQPVESYILYTHGFSKPKVKVCSKQRQSIILSPFVHCPSSQPKPGKNTLTRNDAIGGKHAQPPGSVSLLIGLAAANTRGSDKHNHGCCFL